MSESKEYLVKKEENGTVHISEDVVASIAALAIMDVDGVYGLTSEFNAGSQDNGAKKVSTKGIRLNITDNEICVTCSVILEFGSSIVEIAASVQEKVSAAIEGMTGVPVKSVNVNVTGIAPSK